MKHKKIATRNNPPITNKMRKEIEQKFDKALRTLQGELALYVDIGNAKFDNKIKGYFDYKKADLCRKIGVTSSYYDNMISKQKGFTNQSMTFRKVAEYFNVKL